MASLEVTALGSMALFIPLAFSVFTYVLLKSKLFRKSSKSLLPPGPPADPLIGHLRLIPTVSQDLYFYDLGKTYGDVVHLNVLGRDIIVLNSFAAAFDLLDKKGFNNSDRPSFPIYEHMGIRKGLVFMRYGKDFRMHRTMLQGYFSKEKAKSHRSIQTREARVFTQNLMSTPENREEHLIRFATAIVIEIAFGHRIKTDNDPYVKIAEDITFVASNSGTPGNTPVDMFPFLRYFPSWFPGAYYAGFALRARPLVKRIYEYPLADVRERMAKGTAKDSFLKTQLEALQRKGSDNAATIDDIVGAASVIYIAGSETTSSTLSIFFLAMLLFPECQLKAQHEIDTVVGFSRLPEFHDRETLPYLECLIQETMRWNQAAPLGVPHRSMEDDMYNGMFIPKDSIIIANTRGITLDKNVYQDPLKFDPTRYLPSPAGRDEPYPTAAFGFGRRSCPGSHLANDSVWIVVATVLSTLTISKAVRKDGIEITPEVAFDTGIINHPRPFQCRLEPRTSAARALISHANSAEAD